MVEHLDDARFIVDVDLQDFQLVSLIRRKLLEPKKGFQVLKVYEVLLEREVSSAIVLVEDQVKMAVLQSVLLE